MRENPPPPIVHSNNVGHRTIIRLKHLTVSINISMKTTVAYRSVNRSLPMNSHTLRNRCVLKTVTSNETSTTTVAHSNGVPAVETEKPSMTIAISTRMTLISRRATESLTNWAAKRNSSHSQTRRINSHNRRWTTISLPISSLCTIRRSHFLITLLPKRHQISRCPCIIAREIRIRSGTMATIDFNVRSIEEVGRGAIDARTIKIIVSNKETVTSTIVNSTTTIKTATTIVTDCSRAWQERHFLNKTPLIFSLSGSTPRCLSHWGWSDTFLFLY